MCFCVFASVLFCHQVFQELHDGDANVLVCAPTGCGKTACAEFALFRLFDTNPTARAVYIAPKADVCFASGVTVSCSIQ